MNSKVKRELVGVVLILALLLGFWVYSEIRYANNISPRSISYVNEFFKRFGEPQSVYILKHDAMDYYEFRSAMSAFHLLGALPSGPPAYIFDEQGRFVTWCPDLGNAPTAYRQEWPLNSTNKLEIKAVRQKFGLQ